MPALAELETAYQQYRNDPDFLTELQQLLRDYVGRATPLYFAERLTTHYARPDGTGPQIYLKREDLNHTGAHKINNALGQVLLAKRMGKQRIFRMKLMGAEVRPVAAGTGTLKDATSEAIRDWVTNVETTHYILGSVAGPHPYPMMVRDFHAVIGQETRAQAQEKWGGLPDILMACVGGGSNAMGLFYEFVNEPSVRMIGIEAAGEGVNTNKHAATLTKGQIGVLHGAMSYLLQDEDGQVVEAHSISAGLDYPGVGPEHSYLKDTARAEYYSVTDAEALAAFQKLSRLEGIIPALETSHAIAYLETLCPQLAGSPRIVINCSGRGDKDVQTVAKFLNPA